MRASCLAAAFTARSLVQMPFFAVLRSLMPVLVIYSSLVSTIWAQSLGPVVVGHNLGRYIPAYALDPSSNHV